MKVTLLIDTFCNFDLMNDLYLQCDITIETFDKVSQLPHDEILLICGQDLLRVNQISSLQNTKVAILDQVSVHDYVSILHHFDYVFVPSQQDSLYLQAFIEASKVKILPLKPLVATKHQHIEKFSTLKAAGKEVVGISISNDVNLTSVVTKFLKRGCHVVFISRNDTDEVYHKRIVHYILSSTSYSLSDFSILDDTSVTPYLDMYIPTDFGGVFQSICSNIKMFPIFTGFQVRNLLVDLNWLHAYEVRGNTLDEEVLWSRIEHFYKQEVNCNMRRKQELNYEHGFIELCLVLTQKPQTIVTKIHDTVQTYARSKGYTDFREVTNPQLQDVIVKIVTSYVRGNSLQYTHGLKSKMFNPLYNWYSDWTWLLEHGNLERQDVDLPSNSDGLFNLGYIDQYDYSGCHRSGWQYVYESLKPLNNNDSPLLLDLYMDRTFHWDLEKNVALGLIPYTQPWIGFIHHTFDTTFSSHNCVNLLESKHFIDSLNTCCGLFVLSKNLEEQLTQELRKRDNTVPVITLVHPTMQDVPRFSMKRFEQNPCKKVIHVGGWLRNVHSFYTLQLPNKVVLQKFLVKKKFMIDKYILKGKHMDNYFPHPTFIHQLKRFLSFGESTAGGNVSCNVTADTDSSEITNNWHKHFYEATKTTVQSINFIETQDNDQYDVLLSENIVFLNLVDASAVNTIIECIVRNTPIIVNKHPAVVELLGPKYPLYFSDPCDVYSLLESTNIIKRAHRYLKRLDKTKLSIDYFLKTFVDAVKELL